MSLDYSKVENEVLSRNEELFLKNGLDQMLDILGADFRLTPEERITISKISHSNKGFVQDSIEAIRNYPEMMPGYIDQAKMETAWTYFQQLTSTELKLNRLAEVMRDRRLLIGSALYRDSRTVYRVLMAGDGHAIGGLESIAKRMKHRFATQSLNGNNSNQEEPELNISDQPDEPDVQTDQAA